MSRPFLKWVGGKTRLLSDLKELIPDNYNHYFEPMLGGGAVFFAISKDLNGKVYLNDINNMLICAYTDVRDRIDDLVREVGDIEKKYIRLDSDMRKEFYYDARKRYNRLSAKSLEKTVLLIFLNKTGYNGMYRENSNGEYNIPYGLQEKPKILQYEILHNASKALRGVKLTSGAFEKAVLKAKKNDFIYFDPPYHPSSDTASFTKYSGLDFGREEQFKLKNLYDKLSSRGCKYSTFQLNIYRINGVPLILV